jgi:prophage antirepressor-like protein
MSTELIPFDFEGRQVRVVTDAQGEPWFVAADVCAALHLPDTHKAVARLDDDEKGRNSIPTLGGDQEMTVVNEPGLYSLVLGSRKPEAKRFKRWVTHEVLPTIRKTGRYALSGTPALPAPTPDRVCSILLIGEAVAKVPGVKPGIAMAATLTCIQENTGLAVETLRRALPARDTAANEAICSLNATQLGRLLGLSAKATNQRLARHGLQFRNERDEWELTEAGEAWAEAMPYSRNGHSGYQILWNPAVAERLKEVA